MDYFNMIDRELVRVFAMTRSLQTTAVFNLKQGESFNFGTAQPTNSGSTAVPKQVLVIETKHKQEVTQKQLLIERIDDLSIFDNVTLDGQKWTLGDVMIDNDHIQIIEVFHG